MGVKTAVLYITTGFVALAGIAANILYGKDRSRELYQHERTSKSERIVYQVNRWFMDPMYEITEYVPLNDLIDQEWAQITSGIGELEGITLPHLAPDAPLMVYERRFDPTYINPQFFNKTDTSYEVLHSP